MHHLVVGVVFILFCTFSDQAENWIKLSHYHEGFNSAWTKELKNGYFLAEMFENAYFLYFENGMLYEYCWNIILAAIFHFPINTFYNVCPSDQQK